MDGYGGLVIENLANLILYLYIKIIWKLKLLNIKRFGIFLEFEIAKIYTMEIRIIKN